MIWLQYSNVVILGVLWEKLIWFWNGNVELLGAVFESLISWNNEKGAESVGSGAIIFLNFVLVNNEVACLEFKLVQTKKVSLYAESKTLEVSGQRLLLTYKVLNVFFLSL